jgi:ABC-type branched-subunit amino acid transport system ATPase component
VQLLAGRQPELVAELLMAVFDDTARLELGADRPVAGDVLLRVEDLDFSYGQLQVLFGISMDVRQGESLAVLGTNGAGKSTLLRVIAGLERPSRGSIVFAGRNIVGTSAEALSRRGLVLIPGGRAVFTDMTVEENLEMQGLPLRRQRPVYLERRERALATFPALARSLRRPAGRLSGGEQQQLAVAKALLLEPKLLCVDELSLGLAPVIVGELLEIVQRLNESGITTVVVEQSLNIACRLCERAVFIEKGEIRFEGPTAELLERDDIARAVFFGDGDR